MLLPREGCIVDVRSKVEFTVIRQIQTSLLEVHIRINAGTIIGLSGHEQETLYIKKHT